MHMAEYLGDKLKKLRESAGLQQAQVAKLLGLERTTVYHYEFGDRQPSLQTLVRYAEIFHVTTDYLLGRSTRDMIDVSGLSESEVNMVQGFVACLTMKNVELKKLQSG